MIENTYAKSLRKLIKNFEFNKKLSNKDFDEDKLTHLQCFSRLLNELKNIAAQHELIAENVQKKIVEKLSVATKSFKEDRRRHVEEKDRLYNLHANCEKLLKKRKQQYELSFKDLEKAKESLHKLENDCNSSRNDLKKQQNTYEQKLRVVNLCKSDYAKYLADANQIKNEYYRNQLPNLLLSLQSLEEKRIKLFQNLVIETVSIEAETLSRIQRALKDIEESAYAISFKNDIESVIISYKTNQNMPNDHIFEDLNDPKVIAARLIASKNPKKVLYEINFALKL
jgi:formin-binding protein 1